MTREPLVKVYESQGAFPAEVVKAKLEANGIPVLLKWESVGWIMGITVDGLGRVEVHVPIEYEDEARFLVREDDEDELVAGEAVDPLGDEDNSDVREDGAA